MTRRPAPRPRRRGCEGFLMVEALAALALGALILVGMLSLTGLLRRSADRAAWSVEVSEVSARTVATIARELRLAQRRRWAAAPQTPQAASSARRAAGAAADAETAQRLAAPAQGRNAAGGEAEQPEGAAAPAAPPRPFVFSGAPDRVAFALTPRQETGLRAPVYVAWQIEASGAALRAEGPLRFDAMSPAAIEFGPVARIDPGPERLRFAYVEKRPGGGEFVRDDWTDVAKMPVAVRIDRFDARTGQPVGSLRVPLLVDAEPGCAGQRGLCSRGAEPGQGQGEAGAAQPAAKTDASGEQQ